MSRLWKYALQTLITELGGRWPRPGGVQNLRNYLSAKTASPRNYFFQTRTGEISFLPYKRVLGVKSTMGNFYEGDSLRELLYKGTRL